MVPATTNETVITKDDEAEGFKRRINDVSSQVHQLEQKVQEIESFYSKASKKQSNNSKGTTVLRENDKVRHATCIEKQQDNEEAAYERMQELMRQFGIILNQVTQRKGARSSMDIIGGKDLGLHDSSEDAGKPRDFSMIKKRMEIKDGSGYKHVREIYADVRSVLKYAMKHNDERSDAHVTAKTLLAKFEEKWLILLPKVMQEEERRQEEQTLQKTYHARMAKDISNKLYEVEKHLKELRELVSQKCRRMSILEKRQLGKALTQLSPDNLMKALEIVAQSNPAFQVTTEEVDLDIDAQDESTLRQLKYFVLDIRQAQCKPRTSIDGDNNNDDHKNTTNTFKPPRNAIIKRKRETSDALANIKKKIKKSIV